MKASYSIIATTNRRNKTQINTTELRGAAEKKGRAGYRKHDIC